MAGASQRAKRLRDEIGRELRAARVARGLSQATLAAGSNVEQAEISRIERGLRAGVTLGSLSRLAAGVGLELSVKLYPPDSRFGTRRTWHSSNDFGRPSAEAGRGRRRCRCPFRVTSGHGIA
jgi:transcriptional regulator with XRE-family HTH domain